MILLGSTGSIGVNTIEIAHRLGLEIEVLGAGRNIELLNSQIQLCNPKIVVVSHQEDVAKVAHHEVLWGEHGIKEAISRSSSELVVNAIVGFAGLVATLEANRLGKKIALANKESLVIAGKYIDTERLVPIDSEHFGLWYLLMHPKPFRKLHISASGGAFRDWELDKISNATLSDALKHPNWSMGAKITIDSATMANKLFELLEARWLFDTTSIDAFIETRSLIHSLVEYHDGSTTAHFAKADMRLPIAFALNPFHELEVTEPIDFATLGRLEMRPIEAKRYPLWAIKDELLANPDLGVVINAANEAAIEKFVAGKIAFGEISSTILGALERFSGSHSSIDEVYAMDKEVRLWVSNKR